MQPSRSNKLFEWGIIALLALLLIFIQRFTPGISILRAGTAFTLLAAYCFLSEYFFKNRYDSKIRVTIHVTITLTLCAFVVWSTTTAYEESAFWAIFLLPIVTIAMRTGLSTTLTVTGMATLVYFLLIPIYDLSEQEIITDIPEFITPAIVFFFVAVLVQSLSREMRRQLLIQQDLNQTLVENQRSLSDSLNRLAQAENKLQRQERLAALGEMAAGLAHEIRNPLGIVASSAQLLGSSITAKDKDTEELLLVIQEETQRLDTLLNNFLCFGREVVPLLQPCNLNEFVQTCMNRFSEFFRAKNLDLDIRCTEKTLTAKIDRNLMEQVLLNLVLNAVEASSSGGKILVTCTSHKNNAVIEINDTGEGIPEAIKDKVFNPFFTTKTKGSGLGLAIAYQCVQAHMGSIDIIDHPGQGTRVRIKLPMEKR
ncbi:ATP-binding protein [Desulfoplanes sp. PS50]